MVRTRGPQEPLLGGWRCISERRVALAGMILGEREMESAHEGRPRAASQGLSGGHQLRERERTVSEKELQPVEKNRSHCLDKTKQNRHSIREGFWKRLPPPHSSRCTQPHSQQPFNPAALFSFHTGSTSVC